MRPTSMDAGVYVEHDGRPAVRFQRTYPHSVERLWAAVSDPEELAHWFPATVALEPRAGGTITFSGDPNTPSYSGTILVFEPPTRLAFTWGSSELHIEIAPEGTANATLTLTNVLEAKDEAARNAAGWAVCLAELGKHLAGQTVQGPHGETAESWREHYDAYVASGMPSGAAFPSQA